MIWKIWLTRRFTVVESSVFAVVGERPPWELGADAPLHASSSCRVTGSRSPHVKWSLWSAFCLAWNVGRSELLDVDWPRGRSLPESPMYLTRWLVVTPIAEPLSVWAADILLLLPPRAHVLLYRDGWRPVLARKSAFAWCSSSCHHRSITIWTSYPRERADGSSLSRALTSCRLALLWAMIVVRGYFVEGLGVG